MGRKIKSNYALLDVMGKRRHEMAEHFLAPDAEFIPVVIYGRIVRQHGNDDGTSIEFTVDVTQVVEI